MTAITTAERLDVSTVVLDLGQVLHSLKRLAADPDFLWRFEDEPDSLLSVVLAARARTEDLRFVPEPERGQRLRLIWNSLPHARFRQLIAPESHEPEAA